MKFEYNACYSLTYQSDRARALEWLRMAAEAGDADSMYQMYLYDEELVSVSERDSWLIKAAEAGHRLGYDVAEWNLAKRYVSGKSWRNSTIERDLHKAWFWAKKIILEQANEVYPPERYFQYKMTTIKRIYDGAPDLRDDITTMLNQFNMLYALQNPECLYHKYFRI